ncbi:MAG: polyprenyl synthetase family protein [Ignavibacteriaceae bacterium]|nr:polyprenyl synthetase family protein [Ignavibacteriaceae bacterium]
MEKFTKLYKNERIKIDKKIIGVFKNRKPASLYEPASYIMVNPGKRLRPFIVLACAKAVGGKFSDAYNAAVAVELLHNFTLVHDDIMDNADKRRGLLTLHKRYDLSTAILVGDSLLAIAYEYILKDVSDKHKQVVGLFTRGLVEVCEGQSLDKIFETRERVTIEEYMEMIKKKTALLVEMCCSIGAHLGGGSKQQIKALENYGLNLGIAFQIQDDLLDITAQEAEFGKVIGGDLIEGKKTYLFLKALQKATGANKKKLLQVILNKGIKPEEVNLFRDLYEELGVLKDAREEIAKFTSKSLKSLKLIPQRKDRELLEWLAHSLIKRTK